MTKRIIVEMEVPESFMLSFNENVRYLKAGIEDSQQGVVKVLSVRRMA